MATDVQKIAEAFRLLAEVALPEGYVENLRPCVLSANDDATKAGRAKFLLATRGRKEAAAMMACSEAQIYKLCQVKPSKK